MPQPYDYGALMGQAANLTNISPGIQQALLNKQVMDDNALKLRQAQEAERQQQISYQQQQQRAQAMQSSLQGVLANPNAQNVARFGMQFPEAFEPIKKAYDVLDTSQRQQALQTNLDVAHLLQSDNPQAAVDLLTQHMDAARSTGEDVSSYPHLIQLIQQNPAVAKTMAWGGVYSALGPDKFGEAYGKISDAERADALQPAIVRKANAEASTAETTAQFAPQKAQSDLATEQAQRERMAAQTANEIESRKLGWAQLGLDKDKLATETQLKLQELQLTAGKIPENALGTINTRITDATTSQALATRADDLAAQLRASGARGGAGSGWAEWLKQKTGNQDAVSQLRSEVSQFTNSAALKLLPPGPASDKDVLFVKQGFPKPTDPADYVAKWFEKYASLQRRVAAASERQGNWMAANGGSLGPARTDITVGGVQVRAGTKFSDFNKSGITQENAATLPAGIDALAQRYGRR